MVAEKKKKIFMSRHAAKTLLRGGLNQNIKVFIRKLSNLVGVLKKLMQFKQITDGGLEATTPAASNFLFF